MIKTRSLISLLVLIAFYTIHGQVAAQQTDSYPARSPRLIVPSTPGGNPDVLARLLAEKYSDKFGKRFVVENVPGANGVLAVETVTRAPPDGLTLFVGDTGQLAILPAMTAVSYQTMRDFTPISTLVIVPMVLVVHESIPVKTVAEFVALANSQPKALDFGGVGPGSVQRLAMEIFLQEAGVKRGALQLINYRGGSAAVAALRNREIGAYWSGIVTVGDAIEKGNVRALAVSTAERQKSLPTVPTVVESGYPNFDATVSIGLLGPAGMPQDVVAKLEAATIEALSDPQLIQRLDGIGLAAAKPGQAAYQQLLRNEVNIFTKTVKDLGIPGSN